MAISRKDPKGRKLREGENWRNDGRYSYRYTDVRTGKRLTVYAQDLPELREKEKQIAKDMEDNIEGTVNILEAARKYGVKRIIFSSSAAVYGDIAPECFPVRETEPLRPVSFYGLSKMTCENYIRLYQKAYGLSYVIFRFANVYGERQ